MAIIEDRYLGDDVTVSFDGFHIWLKTSRGDEIALDPDVYDGLKQYEADLCARAKEQDDAGL